MAIESLNRFVMAVAPDGLPRCAAGLSRTLVAAALLGSACAPVPVGGSSDSNGERGSGETFGRADACLFDDSESVKSADAIAAIGVLTIGRDGGTCLGTLVGEKAVLTAQSCLYQVREPIDFRLGGSNTPYRVTNYDPERQPELVGVEGADVALDDIAIVGLETAPSDSIPRATLISEPPRSSTCGSRPQVDVFGKSLDGMVYARYFLDIVTDGHIVIQGSIEDRVDIGGPTFSSVELADGRRIYGIVGVHTRYDEESGRTYDASVDLNLSELEADASEAADSVCVDGLAESGSPVCCVVHPDGFASVEACRAPPASDRFGGAADPSRPSEAESSDDTASGPSEEDPSASADDET